MALYYVDNVNGSDANNGTSEALAKATLAAGVALITADGDILYVQAAGSNYTLTVAQAITIDGTITGGRRKIEGYTTTPGARDGRPTITCATNSINLFELNAASYIDFVHLRLTHTAATRGAAFAGVTASSINIRIMDCQISGCSYAYNGASREAAPLIFLRNHITLCTTGGVYNPGESRLLFNTFYDNTGAGFDNVGAGGTFVFIGNIFGDGTRGIYDTGTTRDVIMFVIGNTFANNSSDGYRSDETTGSNTIVFVNNIFYGNTGNAINLQDTATSNNVLCTSRNNAYGSNTGGNFNNLAAGFGDVTLTGDPFTSGGTGDFTLNNTAGAGAACRAAGLGAP